MPSSKMTLNWDIFSSFVHVLSFSEFNFHVFTVPRHFTAISSFCLHAGHSSLSHIPAFKQTVNKLVSEWVVFCQISVKKIYIILRISCCSNSGVKQMVLTFPSCWTFFLLEIPKQIKTDVFFLDYQRPLPVIKQILRCSGFFL